MNDFNAAHLGSRASCPPDAAETAAKTNRRELLTTSARYIALGGLAILSAGLILRRGGAACPQLPGCRDCTALDRCDLPEAVAVRLNSRRR
jgi:hypothetical protein